MPSDSKILRRPELGAGDLNIEAEETLYDGFFKMRRLSLRHRLFDGGWSDTIGRELFCRGDAVAGILYDPWRDLIGLIEQFRAGAHRWQPGPWCLEVVAGMIDKAGEPPEATMARELQEEAGLQAEAMEPICRYLSSPGGTDEAIHLYALYCHLHEAGGVHGLDTEHEDIRLLVFPAEEVFAAMLTGRMSNAATLIGLQWLQLNRTRIRQQYC